MRTYICVHTYVHTVKLAAGPKGIGLNLDKSHPISEEVVTQAGTSKVLIVVQTTWLCLVGCGK